RAQLLPPNKAGVAMGHWHMIVSDLEVSKKFWVLLGGTPIKIDGTDVIKFPGVFVFLTPGTPLGDNTGTAFTHVGFTILNSDQYLARLRAAGVNFPPPPPNTPDRPNRQTTGDYAPGNGVITTPDGLRVELKGTDYFLSQRVPIGFSPTGWLNIPVASDHCDPTIPRSLLAEVQAWYVKVLGGTAVREANSGRNYAVDWPGSRMRLSGRDEPLNRKPTRGQALDHVGFEVKNLAAFCKKL